MSTAVQPSSQTPMQSRKSFHGDVASHSSTPRIVAIVPRGEVIRNFVYSGAFDQVAEQSSLSLLSVEPSEEFRNMLEERFDQVLPLNEGKERRVVNIQREILELAHGRWLWSEAAQERWRLRDIEATTAGARIKRWSKKLACYPVANRTGLRLFSKLERVSSKRLNTADQNLELFRSLKPSLVFNGSHVHSRVATQAVQAAQWLGIPTATFIFSWDNLTSQGRIMLPYDYYLVWNEAIRDQLLEIYDQISPEQVFVTGTPQFDFHFRPEYFWSREEFCSRVGADPNRPIVLYSTGMANHMPGEPELVEGIADMLAEMGGTKPPQLLVRVYPKDLTGRFEDLKRRRQDILFPRIPWEAEWLTPRFEDSYLLTNTLRHAAVGINVASTVSLELCMFDKPVINVGYNPDSVDTNTLSYARYYDFDHYRPVVDSGAVRVAWSPAEMKVLLGRALSEPSQHSHERKALIDQMFGQSLDGQVASRIANCLLQLAQSAA